MNVTVYDNHKYKQIFHMIFKNNYIIIKVIKYVFIYFRINLSH